MRSRVVAQSGLAEPGGQSLLIVGAQGYRQKELQGNSKVDALPWLHFVFDGSRYARNS